MTKYSDDSFFDGLVYEAEFPVVWTYLKSELSEERAITTNVANEQFLRLMTSLDEKLPEQGEGAEHSTELERLDLKLNVLLDLVGHILRNQLNLPEPENVRLGHSGMEWETLAAPAPGRQVSIRIYIESSLPNFLQFYCEIEGELEEQNNDDGIERSSSVRARYLGLSEPVRDELEKYIFRQHRKKVAYERHPAEEL